MTKTPLDYSNGKIYVIRNHCNSMVYVGHTTQTIMKRFSWHKKNMWFKQNETRVIYNAMKELGPENFYIELVENYPCTSKDELRTREGHYIRLFDSFNNGYNRKVEGRTPKEWEELNKDERKEYHKKKYHNNKDKYSEEKKKYYQDKKEDILQKIKQPYKCECGLEFQYNNKWKHLKTEKHKLLMNEKKYLI